MSNHITPPLTVRLTGSPANLIRTIAAKTGQLTDDVAAWLVLVAYDQLSATGDIAVDRDSINALAARYTADRHGPPSAHHDQADLFTIR